MMRTGFTTPKCWTIAACLAIASLSVPAAWSQDGARHSPIRVTCFDVYGQGERGIGPKNIQRCLSSSTGITFQTVDADDIRRNALAKFDVIICPGGSGSKQSKALDAEGRRAIMGFIKRTTI